MNRHRLINTLKLALCAVAIGITFTANAQSTQGTYLFTGASYWADFESPPSSLERGRVLGTELGVKLGCGHTFSDRWSLEATYTHFDDFVMYGVERGSGDILNATSRPKLLTLSPVLSLPVSKRASATFRVGSAWVEQNSTVYVRKPEVGRLTTKESTTDSHFFASGGLAFNVPSWKSTFELFMTRSTDSSKQFAQSIDFTMRVYF